MNDPTIYTEAAIRHMPELFRAVVGHVVKCEDRDCDLCRVFDNILSTYGEQSETARADKIHSERQEEVRQRLERQVD